MARQKPSKGAEVNQDIELMEAIKMIGGLTEGLDQKPEQRMTPMETGPQPIAQYDPAKDESLAPVGSKEVFTKKEATKEPYNETEDLLSQLSAVKGEPSEQAMPFSQPTSESAIQTAQEPTREPSGMQMSDMDALLVGATPLLAGLLTGNMGDAYSASSTGMMTLAKWRMEQEKKKAKEKALNVEKIVGPDGKAMFVSREQAIGQTPWEKEQKESDFHLQEKIALEKAKAKLKGSDPEKLNKIATDLRTERGRKKLTLNTEAMTQALKKIQVSASTSKHTTASDMALVFNLMKMYDPNSVVRESEYATAEKAGSVPANIRAQFNRLFQGKDAKLDGEVRKNFLRIAQDLYKGQLEVQGQVDDFYKGLAKKSGADPRDVMGSPTTKMLPVEPKKQTQNGIIYQEIDGKLQPVGRVGEK